VIQGELHGDITARTCFFFASRRRHTRSKRDWSSDVCSSDLHSRDRRWQCAIDHGREEAVADVGILDDPRRRVARHHRSPGDQAGCVHVGEESQHKDPSVHQRLERTQEPAYADDDTRIGPRYSHTSNILKDAILVRRLISVVLRIILRVRVYLSLYHGRWRFPPLAYAQ